MKINEYGLFKGSRRVAGRDETSLYRALGLDYIEPELRENRGELEAARTKRLPKLISRADLRGDLHAHTNASDGAASLEEMAQAARALGYEYLAVTDHSQRIAMARGLNAGRLSEQLDAIDRLNRRFPGFRVLKSLEVDILEDGGLDLPEDMLRRLDLAVCSIHSKFNLPEAKQTERILRAMNNPSFSILGHPTGRLLNERAAYAVDLEKIIHGARERGCFLELNAHPSRLDLSDAHCRLAKALGVKISLATDAHSTQDLNQMVFGLNQARRGWLEPQDVLNTLPWSKLKAVLKRK